MLIKEACLENYTLISRAISCGANRIELCDNLSCGGTTVSKGVMAESKSSGNGVDSTARR